MRPITSAAPGVKAALLLGFGLTLALWLWAGYDLMLRMRDVERRAVAINLRYMHAQERLASVRPQVLLVSVHVRNALLDTDPGNLDDYRRRIRRLLNDVDRTLLEYVPVLDSAEQRRVASLRTDIQKFGAAILEVMAADAARPLAETRDLLARAAPRREVIIGVTDEVQALNRAAFQRQQAATAEAYGATERAMWQRLGLSVLASLAIACFATVYVAGLEVRLKRERQKDVLKTRDLQRLSARLVRAQEEERRTIARELHDEVGQVLMAITVELALAQKRLEATAFADVLRDAQSITEGAVHTVRDLSHLLHPALLDDLGLAAAVEWYLEAFGRRHRLRAALVQEEMAQRLPPEIEIAAFRIIQEALTNVAKHAGAASCQVRLRRFARTLQIAVDDDGAGFDLAAVEIPSAHRGLGLLGLRERVWQLLGTIRVDSAPGRGTRITVELPVHQPPAAADVAAATLHGTARAEAAGG